MAGTRHRMPALVHVAPVWLYACIASRWYIVETATTILESADIENGPPAVSIITRWDVMTNDQMHRSPKRELQAKQINISLPFPRLPPRPAYAPKP